jgi:hypothetical protein
MRIFLIIAFCTCNLLFPGCSKDNTVAAVDVPPNVTNPVVTVPNPFSEVGSIFSYAPESSGIVFSDGFIYTFNDSGNPNKFYKVNQINAALMQTITVTNYNNVDWEDITADENYIYIGEFGNNNGTRTDLKVLKISKSQFVNDTASTVNVTAEAISFSYADQTSFISSSTHNFDCETVISKGDSLYIFTKDRGDNATRVYKLSKNPGQYSLTSFTNYNVNGLVTGGDYNSQTNEIVLIGYTSGHKNSFVYSLSNFNGDFFFSGNVTKKIIGNTTNEWQTEGIAYDPIDANKLFFSCESTTFTPAKLYVTSKTSLGL